MRTFQRGTSRLGHSGGWSANTQLADYLYIVTSFLHKSYPFKGGSPFAPWFPMAIRKADYSHLALTFIWLICAGWLAAQTAPLDIQALEQRGESEFNSHNCPAAEKTFAEALLARSQPETCSAPVCITSASATAARGPEILRRRSKLTGMA